MRTTRSWIILWPAVPGLHGTADLRVAVAVGERDHRPRGREERRPERLEDGEGERVVGLAERVALNLRWMGEKQMMINV